MCVSRAICAILLVLKLSFQNCPTFKQRFGAPLESGSQLINYINSTFTPLPEGWPPYGGWVATLNVGSHPSMMVSTPKYIL